jgi:hypothetical protein
MTFPVPQLLWTQPGLCAHLAQAVVHAGYCRPGTVECATRIRSRMQTTRYAV